MGRGWGGCVTVGLALKTSCPLFCMDEMKMSQAMRMTAPYKEKRELQLEPLLGEELVTGQDHLFGTWHKR